MGESAVEQTKEHQKLPKKRSWIAPTVTTLIGVLVSLAIAWYQITLSNEQALQAEMERAKAVRNELTQIVEEHVINHKTLDVSRLARLSELRTKQEKLLFAPSVSEIIETAEYNILKSQYLDFEKKEQYKLIFDEIYSGIYASPFDDYRGLFGNSVNELYAAIQQGTTSDSLEKLNKVLADFNSQVTELEGVKSVKSQSVFEDMAKVIIERPHYFIAAMMIYAFALYCYALFRRKRRFRAYHGSLEREFEEELKRRYRASMEQ